MSGRYHQQSEVGDSTREGDLTIKRKIQSDGTKVKAAVTVILPPVDWTVSLSVQDQTMPYQNNDTTLRDRGTWVHTSRLQLEPIYGEPPDVPQVVLRSHILASRRALGFVEHCSRCWSWSRCIISGARKALHAGHRVRSQRRLPQSSRRETEPWPCRPQGQVCVLCLASRELPCGRAIRGLGRSIGLTY